MVSRYEVECGIDRFGLYYSFRESSGEEEGERLMRQNTTHTRKIHTDGHIQLLPCSCDPSCVHVHVHRCVLSHVCMRHVTSMYVYVYLHVLYRVVGGTISGWHEPRIRMRLGRRWDGVGGSRRRRAWGGDVAAVG